MAMSRLSKQQLAGKLVKKTLTLDEKIKFLDFAKKKSKTWMLETSRYLQDQKDSCSKYLKE